MLEVQRLGEWGGTHAKPVSPFSWPSSGSCPCPESQKDRKERRSAVSQEPTWEKRITQEVTQSL